ncbi:39S ribosomal protein L12, mitochondrial [Sabethes cyaneus]|uniref:39S ribosomal protein L12, mitochondrial n=1 Tax=Sabethes cyaneus TaxID=53552 RepID=UPI00221E29AB|nr:39S ribosomal protein L12, mitochondrial [Sabethes cyaneus]
MMQLRSLCGYYRCSVRQIYTTITVRNAEAAVASAGDKLTVPVPEGSDKPANPKLVSIVDNIAALNLLEVSELSGLLKKRLNLPDAALMPAGFGAGFAPAATGPAADEEEAAPKVVKTLFKVKLVKFDDKQKVALIKEVKNLLDGMNLVQAKKFVESAPTMVKEDISKEEAEKLKEAFTKVGAVIEIE